ncbi:Uncharacterized protein APZ42_017780 [Daphnia magna]|uniref:Uncharacterized protein n=1 Tax=Daphnia magna TaxID=35525 RepID=A0A0N8EKK5_9CRUS|nr:Uncharacterized protein APZ42_017780 [Daphnia magna]
MPQLHELLLTLLLIINPSVITNEITCRLKFYGAALKGQPTSGKVVAVSTERLCTSSSVRI